MTDFFYITKTPCRISMSPRDPDDYPEPRTIDPDKEYDLARQNEIDDARDVLREQAERRAADECRDVLREIGGRKP